jgi:hypothetical protein
MEHLPQNHRERIPTPTEKLRHYLATEAEKLARDFAARQSEVSEGKRLTVGPDFRLVPPKDLYGTKEATCERQLLEKMYNTTNPEAIILEENKDSGSKFEMLKTAIMHKQMGQRFMVVRSSRYDDYANGVDNVLVDKTNGEIVCALDEVNTSFQGDKMIQKAVNVLSKNFGENFARDLRLGAGLHRTPGEKGVRLKYGIKLGADGKMRCEELEHIPIFLIGVDDDHLDEGQRTLIDGEGKSRYETELFKYFLQSLSTQITLLKLKPARYQSLPEELRKRVESFEVYLREALKEVE